MAKDLVGLFPFRCRQLTRHIPNPGKTGRTFIEDMLDESLQERHAVTAPDHLGVHGQGEYPVFLVLDHVVEIAGPELKNLGCRIEHHPQRIKIEVEMGPDVQRKVHGELPNVRLLTHL